MVALFVISVTPTAQTIQRQNLGSSERLKKAVSWPMILKRIKSVNLKMAISILFLLLKCSVRLLTYCVLPVINVYWIRLDELHSDKRVPPPAGVHYYICVSPSVRAYLSTHENAITLEPHGLFWSNYASFCRKLPICYPHTPYDAGYWSIYVHHVSCTWRSVDFEIFSLRDG